MYIIKIWTAEIITYRRLKFKIILLPISIVFFQSEHKHLSNSNSTTQQIISSIKFNVFSIYILTIEIYNWYQFWIMISRKSWKKKNTSPNLPSFRNFCYSIAQENEGFQLSRWFLINKFLDWKIRKKLWTPNFSLFKVLTKLSIIFPNQHV